MENLEMEDLRMKSKFIEELSLNNWQPLSTLFYDGWILRFADGYTKRANSINPIYGSSLGIQQKIAYCEQLYKENQLQPTYKITPFVHPSSLDSSLEQAGYLRIDTSSVQTMQLKGIKQPYLHTVKIDEQLSQEWLDSFCQFNQIDTGKKTTMTRMLANIKTKKAFISFYNEGRTAACGLGIIEGNYIGLYDIVTNVKFRNRGFAEQMILHLLHWGVKNGATDSYLAVVANNAPAIKLYAKLGYKEIYQYWYRVKDTSSYLEA